jgi:hypothetical protein
MTLLISIFLETTAKIYASLLHLLYDDKKPSISLSIQARDFSLIFFFSQLI